MAELISVSTLTEKYRPNRLTDIVGQESAVSIVNGFIKRKQVPSTILICSSPGTGKTTLAKIIARDINDGLSSNTFDINVGSDRSVDSIRNLAEECKYKPMKGRFKVYILDEVHCLTGAAESAFLKVGENPPPHVVFILCTSEPDRLNRALKSRCRIIALNDVVSDEDIAEYLTRVCRSEKIKLGSKTIAKIASAANGSPRESLQILSNVFDIIANTGDNTVDETVIVNAIKSLDIAPEKVAMKTLLSVFCGSLVPAMKCMNDTSNHRSLIGLMSMLAWGVICSITNSGTINFPQKTFFNILSNKMPDVKLETAVEVYAMISQIRKDLMSGASDEKAVIASGIGRYILGLKKS